MKLFYHGGTGLFRTVDCPEALGLPDITEHHFSKNVWKRLVTKACLAYENEAVSKIIYGYKKLIDLRNEPYGLNKYIKRINIKSAKLLFAEDSKMLDAKLNYKNDPRYKMQAWK